MTRPFLMLMVCCLSQPTLLGQEQASENVPAKNTAREPLPAGQSVLGVFDGRTPCQEIAKQWNVKTTPECNKIKWRLILYQNPATHSPTTFTLEGFVFRNPPLTGKWHIVKGTKNDPNAVLYQLDTDKLIAPIYLYKGDDNVLFSLDKHKNFMVGNEDFSYTLNRTGE